MVPHSEGVAAGRAVAVVVAPAPDDNGVVADAKGDVIPAGPGVRLWHAIRGSETPGWKVAAQSNDVVGVVRSSGNHWGHRRDLLLPRGAHLM